MNLWINLVWNISFTQKVRFRWNQQMNEHFPACLEQTQNQPLGLVIRVLLFLVLYSQPIPEVISDFSEWPKISSFLGPQNWDNLLLHRYCAGWFNGTVLVSDLNCLELPASPVPLLSRILCLKTLNKNVSLSFSFTSYDEEVYL